MDPLTTSALIGAGSNLVGGLLGGGGSSSKDRALQEWIAKENLHAQKQFAQEGIRWRVADAKAAGLHPLAALGMQPASANPISIMPVGPNSDRSNLGNAIADAGSGIARAMAAGQSNIERLNERLLAAQIDGQEIENARRRAEIALTSGAQIGPGFPPVSSRDGADDRRVTPMYSTVMTPAGPRRMVSADYGQVLENDVSEFIRYLPRDLYDRGSRLGSAVRSWWGRLSSRPRPSYFPEGR